MNTRVLVVSLSGLLIAGAVQAQQTSGGGASAGAPMDAPADGSESTPGAAAAQTSDYQLTNMLSFATVQAELALTPGQVSQLKKLAASPAPSGGNLTPEQLQAATRKLGQQRMAVLTPAQRDRLEQIDLWLGVHPLNRPQVRDRLELTAQQKTALEKIDRERDPLNPDSGVPRIVALLTPAQRQTLDRIAGRQFVLVPHKQTTTAGPSGGKPMERLAAGRPAPDFTVVGRDGKDIRLSALRGKTVVLDFWATWCAPCIESLPGLEALHRQTQDQNVVVMALNVGDGKAAYEKWLAANAKYTMPIARDLAGGDSPGVRALFGIEGIPSTFVIGADGKVLGSTEGSLSSANAQALTKAWDGKLGAIDERVADILRKAGIQVRAGSDME